MRSRSQQSSLVPDPSVTDDDVRALAREAEEQQDERLRRVCMAALDPAAAQKLNIRREFAREQCERFILEARRKASPNVRIT
jgi:hypothetical protein